MGKNREPTEVLDLNEVKYVLQRCNRKTGEWYSFGMAIIGKKKAISILNTNKQKDPSHDWRVVPKVVADAYKQGWVDALWAWQNRWLSKRDVAMRLTQARAPLQTTRMVKSGS